MIQRKQEKQEFLCLFGGRSTKKGLDAQAQRQCRYALMRNGKAKGDDKLIVILCSSHQYEKKGKALASLMKDFLLARGLHTSQIFFGGLMPTIRGQMYESLRMITDIQQEQHSLDTTIRYIVPIYMYPRIMVLHRKEYEKFHGEVTAPWDVGFHPTFGGNVKDLIFEGIKFTFAIIPFI